MAARALVLGDTWWLEVAMETILRLAQDRCELLLSIAPWRLGKERRPTWMLMLTSMLALALCALPEIAANRTARLAGRASAARS